MNQKNNLVLAVVGLPGTGKTEAVNYIMEQTNWPKVYLGDVTFDILKERNLPFTQENERPVREEIRAVHGMAAYAKLSMPKIKELYKNSNVIIESMYSWEEYLLLREEFGDNFKALAIYTSPKTRIERLANRPERPLTEQELIDRDFSQIENLHQAGPIARADFTVINESDQQNLEQELDKIIKILQN